MSDLISRSALIEEVREYGIYGSGYSDAERENDVIDRIESQPTIEAEPVVHGEWIYENYTWHCGVCGFHPFKGYIPKTPGFNICPNCGADMRKGGD